MEKVKAEEKAKALEKAKEEAKAKKKAKVYNKYKQQMQALIPGIKIDADLSDGEEQAEIRLQG